MFFRRRKKEKELYKHDWSIKEVADVLEVSKESVKRHLKRHKLYNKIYHRWYKFLIPQEMAERILGLKSNPPDDIDEIEYVYPLWWLRKKMNCSRRKILQEIRRKGLYKYLRRDSYGRYRIPRSICKIVYPYIGRTI